MTNAILEILSEDSRRTPEEIAVMLDADLEDIRQKIKSLKTIRLLSSTTQ